MNDFICAFTGHRPKKFPWGYDENATDCMKLKQELTSQIITLINLGAVEFLSGMAEGTDTWAALSVLALREKNPTLKLHCVLPCENQADKWSAFARERYTAILTAADKVTYVRREYTPDCMLERNRYLVDHADVLLAVYNGERRGGTAATVRYAQKCDRKLIIIDPASLQVTCSPEDWIKRLTTAWK